MKISEFIRLLNRSRVAVLFACCLTSCDMPAIAQDVHFSQLAQTPLLVNPALTGIFNGNSRAFINYRNQWVLLDKAYQTSAFSFDSKMLNKQGRTSYYGAGITAFADKAGDFNLRTTSVSLYLSGVVEVGEKQIISGGIQGGLGQNSIDIQNPRTSAQYLQTYDPSLPSGENIGKNSLWLVLR